MFVFLKLVDSQCFQCWSQLSLQTSAGSRWTAQRKHTKWWRSGRRTRVFLLPDSTICPAGGQPYSIVYCCMHECERWPGVLVVSAATASFLSGSSGSTTSEFPESWASASEYSSLHSVSEVQFPVWRSALWSGLLCAILLVLNAVLEPTTLGND